MRPLMLSTAVVLTAAMSSVASFQLPQADGLPPPSFGTAYVAGTALDGFEMRRFRDWQVNVTVSVPTVELKAVLPVGYDVVNPAAATAAVTIAFVLQERAELITVVGGNSPGTYGPVSEVLVVATGRSPAGLVESVIVDNLRSTQEGVDLTNSIFGPGSARLAETLSLELVAVRGGEALRFSGEVVSGRLNIATEAVFSPIGMTSVRNRPSPAPFRYVNSTFQPAIANLSLRAGTSVDQTAVPADQMYFKRDQIKLPQGTLTVLGIVSGRIDRWQEFVQKLQ